MAIGPTHIIEEYITGDFNAPSFGGVGGSDAASGKQEKTTMKMTYEAIGEFSVDEGRWSSYNGIMSINTSGLQDYNSTKKFSLLSAK